MRHPAYPEYKDSGMPWLGRVPGHWEVKRLKFIFPRPCSGVSVNSENLPADSDSVGVMKTSCVFGNRFNPGENKKVLDDELEKVACPVTGDSLIISRMNTPELVGNCGYVDRDYINLFLPDRLWIARFSGHQSTHGKYAWYLCVSDGLTKLTGALATGTSGSMKNLSQEAFFSIAAIIPPLPEQTAIADFLDRETGRIDTLVTKKRRLIALLREKRTALISRTVTRGLPEVFAREFGLEPHARFKDSGIEWLGEVPEGWEVKRLKFAFPRLFSGVSVNSDSSPADQESIGVLKTSCVYGNQFSPTENKRVVDNDIDRVACPVTADSLIISRMNTPELVGNCGYVAQDYLNLFLPDRLWIARFCKHQGMYGKYAWYFCISDGITKLTAVLATGTSGSMKNLSQEAFLNIEAIVPPYGEQAAIATYLDRETAKIDRLVEKVEAAIDRLQEYRTALITAAVTGKIDVRNTRQQEAVA